MLCVCLAIGASAQRALQFDAQSGDRRTITLYDGTEVAYTAYEHLYYVTQVEDSTYQYLNLYVPDGATQQTPIFLRTYVGGYMASAATQPQADDATGRALKEGYVVVIPGTRGRNSTVVKHKETGSQEVLYTGRAPKAILDLKAAIRYLRHFDHTMAGNAERIITDGTSAGGAMSALMGTTGNHPLYEPMLKEMGPPKPVMTCLPLYATAPSSTWSTPTWLMSGSMVIPTRAGNWTKPTDTTHSNWPKPILPTWRACS